jgi:hypothetical protein
MLFAGVESYMTILRKVTGVTFVTGEPYGSKQDAAFAEWQQANARQLAVARAAEREFVAESFALSTLCGAILQVADKAIELYGSNGKLPGGLPATLGAKHAKFCVGRTVRTLPLGLVIYAARNQHIHFNDEALREPSASIFRILATAHGYGSDEEIVDPAFALDNQSLLSFASNVTSLIGWRSYEKYASDMRIMLVA